MLALEIRQVQQLAGQNILHKILQELKELQREYKVTNENVELIIPDLFFNLRLDNVETYNFYLIMKQAKDENYVVLLTFEAKKGYFGKIVIQPMNDETLKGFKENI